MTNHEITHDTVMNKAPPHRCLPFERVGEQMLPPLFCSPASLESTDVSNCTYLLVYCRYIRAVVKMNNLFQQNKFVESRWLPMQRRRLFYAQ